MSDQNIFDDKSNKQVTPDNSLPSNLDTQVATLLGNIKNENGEQKYKTVEEALKALSHSQSFIPTLQKESREKDNLIKELTEKAGKIDQLEASLQEIVNRQNTKTNVEIDEEQIHNLVNNSLSKITEKARAESNTKQVIDKLVELHGDKAGEVFYTKALEAGLDKAEINALAAKSPSAVFKLLGLDTAVNNKSVGTGTINSVNLKPQEGSMLGKNKDSVLSGASNKKVIQEAKNAKKLVDELHAQGMSTYDLTDPKVYFKHFE